MTDRTVSPRGSYSDALACLNAVYARDNKGFAALWGSLDRSERSDMAYCLASMFNDLLDDALAVVHMGRDAYMERVRANIARLPERS